MLNYANIVCYKRLYLGAFFWNSQKLLTFGTLTSNHTFFYDFYDSQNSLTFRYFLKEFIKTLSRKRKYIFSLDNAGFHKTQPVRNLLNEYSSFIAVEFLFLYSPELSPIEISWKVTKNAVTKSQYFSSIKTIQEALEDYLTRHIFMQNFITYVCRYLKSN